MPTGTRPLALLLASAGLLTSCTFGGGGDEEPTATDDAAEVAEPAEEPSADPAPAPGGTTEVHELQQLENGVQVAIGPAEVDADLVRVPIDGWNGTTEEILFGGSEPELTDNVGTNYLFLTAESNAEMRTDAGDVMRGVLVFELDGEELPENPGRYNLHLNRFRSGEPQFEFRDIPFDAVGDG